MDWCPKGGGGLQAPHHAGYVVRGAGTEACNGVYEAVTPPKGWEHSAFYQKDADHSLCKHHDTPVTRSPHVNSLALTVAPLSSPSNVLCPSPTSHCGAPVGSLARAFCGRPRSLVDRYRHAGVEAWHLCHIGVVCYYDAPASSDGTAEPPTSGWTVSSEGASEGPAPHLTAVDAPVRRA